MDDDENKPGVTQIPLIHDLVFDTTQPLKPPARPSKPSRKSGPYPPGYDPDTADLFQDITDPVEPMDEPEVEEPDSQHREIEESLRAEISEELGSILAHLKDQPES